MGLVYLYRRVKRPDGGYFFKFYYSCFIFRRETENVISRPSINYVENNFEKNIENTFYYDQFNRFSQTVD